MSGESSGGDSKGGGSSKGSGDGGGGYDTEFGGGYSGTNVGPSSSYTGPVDSSSYYDTSAASSGYDPNAGGGTGYNTNPWSSGGLFDTGGAPASTPMDSYAYAPPSGGGTNYDLPSPILDPGGGGGFNLAGPGPVGGDAGLPGAGGGTNTWGTIPGLTGNEFDYLNSSSPVAAGGVSASTSAASAPAASLDELFGGERTAMTGLTSAPSGPGPSAAATAAPSGVSGIPDLSASSSDRARTGTSGGGTNQMAAAQSPGLLESLGLTGNNRNNLGVLAAGAGLANNLINGRTDPASVDALRAIAANNMMREAELRARSAPLEAAGARTVATGEEMLATGRGAQAEGLEQINQGQSMTQEGQALQQYLQNGTLPAAYESQVQSGVQAAIARVRANHASRGMPTDPARNSTLAEEIRQIEARVPAMRMQMAQSLAGTGTSIVQGGNQTISTGNALLGNPAIQSGNQTITTGTNTANSLVDEGIRATGLSSDIYRTLAGIDQNTQQRRGAAIANFASALNSSPRKAA